MTRFIEIAFAFSALVLVVSSVSAAPLEVSDAWIREAPPAASVLAAYMVIHNAGAASAEISLITSPDFGHVEMHRTVVENGVASMVPIGKLEIPPGEQITLKPGGTHLMLIDPRRPLHEGDTVTLTFQYTDGQKGTFPIPVIRQTGELEHHH
jgi:copper(I)-binding protein